MQQAIRVEIEWKGVMGQRKKKKKGTKEKVFGRRMNGKELDDVDG